MSNFKISPSRSLLPVGPRRGPENSIVKVGEIGRHAHIFPKFGTGDQGDLGCGGHPWLGVRLWISNGHLRFERGVVEAPPSFDDLHLVAVRPAAIRVGFTDP